MLRRTVRLRRVGSFSIVLASLTLAGCRLEQTRQELPGIIYSDIPRELEKATLPAYRVEPPDVLLVEAVNNIRPAEMPLRAGDRLVIRASGLLFPTEPEPDPVEREFYTISNLYVIQPDGTVDLGPIYGSVRVAGLTLEQAENAIFRHLRDEIGLAEPRVAVSLPDLAGRQAVAGELLVTPDGTINLGIYGSVYVAGMTVDEIKQVVEAHLAQFMLDPEVRVTALGYNSKVIYVITDGGGFGEAVVRVPYTGNETVLDVIAQIQGLSEVSSKDIWLARPAAPGMPCAQKMPVDWRGITQDGLTATNYQLFPGDRIYIDADDLITIDNHLAKALAPLERLMGAILLGTGTARSIEFYDVFGRAIGGGFFGGGFAPVAP